MKYVNSNQMDIEIERAKQVRFVVNTFTVEDVKPNRDDPSAVWVGVNVNGVIHQAKVGSKKLTREDTGEVVFLPADQFENEYRKFDKSEIHQALNQAIQDTV